MGLLSAIEQRQKPKSLDTPPKQIAVDTPDPEPVAPSWPICPACGSFDLWVDVYGGGPHCMHCSPPPAPSFVRERLRGPPGSQAETQAETEVDIDREFARHWIVYEYDRKIGIDDRGAPIIEHHRVIQRRDFKWTEPCNKPGELKNRGPHDATCDATSPVQ
jgi:hypothetical protein